MPFNRFPGVDTLLGPEMRSTGEVMGWDRTFPRAFLKAQLGAGTALPTSGTLFVSVKDGDKTERPARGHPHPARPRLPPARHRRHRDLPDRPRHPDHPGQQGLRGPPAHRRHPEGRRRPDRLQHHRRRPVDRRQPRHPLADAVGADPVLHDRRRRAGGGAGDAGSAGGGFAGAVVAGVALNHRYCAHEHQSRSNSEKSLMTSFDQGNTLSIALNVFCNRKRFEEQINQTMGEENGQRPSSSLYPTSVQTISLGALRRLCSGAPDHVQIGPPTSRPSTRSPNTRREITSDTYVISDALHGLRVSRYQEVVADASSAIPKLDQQIAILRAANRQIRKFSYFDYLGRSLAADLFDSEIEAARECLAEIYTGGGRYWRGGFG